MVLRKSNPGEWPFHAGSGKPSTPSVLPDPQFDGGQFEQLIKNRGIRFQVWKRALCPNVNNLDENNHDPNCKLCSNGFIYYGGNTAFGTFSGNSLKTYRNIEGQWQIGQAVVTMQSYLDSESGQPDPENPVCLDNMDKLIAVDYMFRHSERIEHSFATKIDRLRYPALRVDYVASKNRQFYEGTNFQIDPDGNIMWTGTDRPDNVQQLTDRGDTYGEVYTIVYYARPVYYVTDVIHELRATTGWNADRQRKEAIRLPQQVVISRDYLVEHEGDKRGEKFSRFPRGGGSITPG